MKNAVKKALSIMLVAVMLFSVAPLSGFVGLELPDWLDFGKLFAVEAEAANHSGTCGDNLTWSLNTSTGELNITGTGAMTDWSSSSDIPWYNIHSEIKKVSIENGVLSIGNYAFSSCDNLESINIASSVLTVGTFAFYYCTSLKSILLPEGVEEIKNSTFYGCKSLTSFDFPNSLKNIGYQAFSSCSGLTSIDLSDTSVTEIGSDAFYYCTNVKEILLPNTLTSISGSFKGCKSVTELVIPNSVNTIATGSFKGMDSLECLTLPFVGQSRKTNYHYERVFGYVFGYTSSSFVDGVVYQSYGDDGLKKGEIGCYIPKSLRSVTITTATEIPFGAFSNCDFLTEINLPNTVTKIDNWAFRNCSSISSITIPKCVSSIGDISFDFCSNLTDVYFGGTEDEWNAVLIGKNNTPLLNATIHYNEPITVDIKAYAEVDGSVAWSKQFGITISSNDENAPLPENEYSVIDNYGCVSFPIKFTEKDFQGLSSKTFKYDLTISSANGKKYDFAPETQSVEITINNSNGKLTQVSSANRCDFVGYSYKTFEFGLTWDDRDDCCGVRPDSLSLNLVSGRTEEKIPFTISMDSRWSAELSVREVTDDFWYHNYYVEGLDYLENIGYTVSLRESDDGYCVDAVASLSYCTVGFYTENGLSPETQYVVRNSYVAEPKAPVSPYYNFIGWYKDKDCTAGKEWNFETDTVTRNTTLYAKWEPKPIKITLKTEYGTLQEGENIKELTITIPAFSAIGIKLSEELYDSNYNHIGWVDEDGNVITATTELCEDTTLYAVWQKKPYSNATVRIKNNPGSRTINYGESIKLTATVTNKPDNARIYWYVDGEFMGMGEVFDFGFSSGTKIITVKLVDSNENVLKDVNGNEISDSENVTVKAGFFQKLIAFFKKLFGISQTVVQSINF